MLRPGLVWTTYRTSWIKWMIQQCPHTPVSFQYNGFFFFCEMIVFIIFCENLPFLKLSTGTVSILPPNTHTHAHADTKSRFIQTNNCFLTLKEKHPYSSEGRHRRVFVLSVMDIHPTHHKQWPPLHQVLLNLSLFCVTNSPSLSEVWPDILSSNPGLEIIYWQLFHSIRHCQQRDGAGAVCYSCHKVLNVDQLLHGDGSVSEVGWWAAPAASCLCDLTVCVNQERVSARPASLISISLQITPRRRCEGGKL